MGRKAHYWVAVGLNAQKWVALGPNAQVCPTMDSYRKLHEIFTSILEFSSINFESQKLIYQWHTSTLLIQRIILSPSEREEFWPVIL